MICRGDDAIGLLVTLRKMRQINAPNPYSITTNKPSTDSPPFRSPVVTASPTNNYGINSKEDKETN